MNLKDLFGMMNTQSGISGASGGGASGGTNNDLSALLKGRKSNQLKDFFASLGLDVNGNNEVGRMLQNLSAGAYGNAVSRQGFNNGLEGQYQSAFQRLLNSFTEDPNALSKRASENIYANNARGMQQAGAAGQGLGQGLQQGNLNGMGLNASRQASQADQMYRDPQRQQQNLSSILQAITQGQSSNPALDTIFKSFAPIEQRHQQNQSEIGSGSAWNQIGGVVGGLASAYGGGGFGVKKSKKDALYSGGDNNNYG
jgi:hypothetical protein